MSLTVVVCVVVALVVAALLVAAWMLRSKGPFSMDIGGQTPRASGGSDTSAEKGFRTRLLALGGFCAAAFGALVIRLWNMQLVSADEYARLAESNRTRTVSSEAPRGRILDRNGVELVGNRSSLAVVAQPDVADDDLEVRLLANLLGMPEVAVMRKIQSESEGAQSARTVATDVTERTVAILQEHSYAFPGVEIEERTERDYPKGDLACQVLGYTGAVTQEQVDASSQDGGSDDAIAYELGDTVGQSGIEYQYEEVLQGIKGEQTVYVDADGNVLERSSSVAPQAGSDVVLTIDEKIQQAAEDGLDHAIEMAQRAGYGDCKTGAIVVLDCTNGDVLAMASSPRFSPAAFIGGISNADWEAVSSEDSGNPLLNRAIGGLYMSASTIKPLSVFAALDHGIADESTTFYCSGYWTGFGEDYGQYCWNHDGHGTMTLESGIVYSCDPVFYEIAKGFYLSDDDEGLQETFRRWGLGSPREVDLPGEESGRVPDAEWKWDYFSDYSDEDRTWRGGDLTNLVIGQGDILVTPLQMACVYMGIANRGTIWRPHLLREVRSQSGDGAVVEYVPEVLTEVEEDDASFDLVHRALVDVIYVEDPAQASHFTNLSVTVAGKSGTGERTGHDHTAWFCGFVPADDPKYAIACVVEEGGFGSESAIYGFRDTIGGIYDEPDTSTASSSQGVR